MKGKLKRCLAGALATLICFGASFFVACINDTQTSSTSNSTTSSTVEESSSSESSSSSADQDSSTNNDSSSYPQVDVFDKDSYTDTWEDPALRSVKFRVCSYNIAHGLDYSTDPSAVRIHKTGVFLKQYGVDIAGLNEVYDKSSNTDYLNQAGRIAMYAGLQYHVWGQGKQFDWGGNVAIGNAVVSKYKLLDTQFIAVPAPVVGDSDYRSEYSNLYEDRVIVKTTMNVGREICFITTHFGLVGEEQNRMIAELTKVLDAETRPVILCGDFNNSPDSSYLQPIYERLQSSADLTGKRDEYTHSSWKPSQTIDYIFVSEEFTVKDFDVVEVIMSDHMPIWADLELAF